MLLFDVYIQNIYVLELILNEFGMEPIASINYTFLRSVLKVTSLFAANYKYILNMLVKMNCGHFAKA